MLEDRCHFLDIQIAGEIAVKDNKITSDEFKKYVADQKEINDLEYRINDYHEKIQLVQEAINSALIKNPEKEKEIRNIYEPRLTYLNNNLSGLVTILF